MEYDELMRMVVEVNKNLENTPFRYQGEGEEPLFTIKEENGQKYAKFNERYISNRRFIKAINPLLSSLEQAGYRTNLNPN